MSYGESESSRASDDAAGGLEAKSKSGLVLLYAPHFTRFQPAYALDTPELIIGRDAKNRICVPEPAVSRRHACIAYRQGAWVLNDFGSRNGTIVDGAYVGEIELRHLHVLRVGDALFKFVQDSADAYARYRLDGHVSGERLAKSVKELKGGWQMDRVAATIERVAQSGFACLVSGEPGTCKTIAAREIHVASGRRGPFRALDCATTPKELLERELFGVPPAALPGRDIDRAGLLEQARGGTLFLREVGDMPFDVQTKLLSALQERKGSTGDTALLDLDVRIVSSTSRDLYRSVREGRFREDLLAHLDTHPLVLPPLRERKEDMFQLARAFGTQCGRPNLSFALPFMVALLHYDWPLNVRELRSCIEDGVRHTAEGQPLDTPHLPAAIFERSQAYGEGACAAGLPRSSMTRGSVPLRRRSK